MYCEIYLVGGEGGVRISRPQKYFRKCLISITLKGQETCSKKHTPNCFVTPQDSGLSVMAMTRDTDVPQREEIFPGGVLMALQAPREK